jgi:hypothetical protein
MPLPKAGKLNEGNVQKLVAQMRKDSNLKDEAVGALRARGFRATVQEVFELTPQQQAEVTDALPPELEEICVRATLMAIERGGKIEYRHEGHNPPNLTVEAYCKTNECGVRFIC